MKAQFKFIVSGLITTLLLLGSSLLVVSAQCDIDGNPGNFGTSGDNIITCNADNDPAGNSVNGADGNDSVSNNGVTVDSLNGGNNNDTVTNNGTANNINAGNGDDTVINNGTVNNDVNGNSGTNNIDNNGTVGNNINGGSDNDTIVNNNDVQRSVNGGGGNGVDDITNNGSVQSNINAGGGDDSVVNNGTVGADITGDDGNDTIINNGNVDGNIFAGNDNDTVIIQANGTVGNSINGGPGTDTLRFEMLLCELRNGDFDSINDEIENLNPNNDTVTINGVTYEWVVFETLESNITQERPSICFPPEDVFVGFTDGRLNGLQCQVWLRNDAMEIYNYEGLDGIWVTQDNLIDSPTANTLIASNNTDTVQVYQLATGEIQLNCYVWDTYLNQWKIDVYVFQDIYDNQPEVIR